MSVFVPVALPEAGIVFVVGRTANQRGAWINEQRPEVRRRCHSVRSTASVRMGDRPAAVVYLPGWQEAAGAPQLAFLLRHISIRANADRIDVRYRVGSTDDDPRRP